MSRDYRVYLDDILEAATKVLTYTSGYTLQQFEEDPKTVDAVIRNFIVIVEAAKNIPAEVRQLHPEVPWRDMAGLRDMVVHQYFGIRLDILWRVIQDDLSGLVVQVSTMLAGQD